MLTALQSISLPYGRGNVLHGIKESLIIDGTYNGGFEPIIAGVRMASHLAELEDRVVIAIVGDMRELGGEEATRHQELWNTLRHIRNVRYMFIGDISERNILPLVTSEEQQHVSFYRDARKAGEAALQYIQRSEKKVLVFAKGSQNTLYLEEAIKKIILPEEVTKLVRQDDFYRQKKQAFWNILN